MRGGFYLLLLALITGAFAATAATDTPPPAHAIEYVSGDADCSGDVEALDALPLLAEAGDAGDGMCALFAGDVNCDGVVDGLDAVLILRHVAGLSATTSGCPAIGAATESPTTTYELIDAAVEASEITPGQGLLYKLYADFNDDRLPAEYAAAGGAYPESMLFQQIAAEWDSLSSDEKDAIRPFVLPPAEPGSWVEEGDIGAAAIDWATVSSDEVKVWWQTRRPEDEAKANAVLSHMENKIWEDLVTYMGEDHAPFSDALYPHSGGDGKFDIYLVHLPPGPPAEPGGPPTPPVLGYVSPHLDVADNMACELTPTYMNLNSAEPLTPALLSTVAHEFMHAIQFTYDVGSCDDYRWMMEATATWAENFVYPRTDDEHGYGYSFLEDLQKPFETWIYKDLHQYGAYLFWFFLENQYGMHDAVRDSWEASTNPDSLAALESVIAGQGGFKDVWPEFAVYNWNRDPYTEYEQWDKVAAGAKWKDETMEAESGPTVYNVPTGLPHMTQDHYHYTVGGSVHSITIENPFAGTAEEEHAKVQALILRDGQWTRPAEDWTSDADKFFCLDRSGDDIDELVLIISNSDHELRSHTFNVGPIKITASPIGCEGWLGSAHAVVNYFDAQFEVTVDNVLFAPPEDEPLPEDRYVAYKLARADVTWEASGTWPNDCPARGTMELGPPYSGEDDESRGTLVVDREEGDYTIHGSGHNFDSKLDLTCPGGDPFLLGWPVISWIWDGGNVQHFIEVEGGVAHADGTFTDPAVAYGGTWEWTFQEVK